MKRATALVLLFLMPLFAGMAATLEQYAAESYWLEKETYPPVTREALERAVELGRSYFLNHQKADGNFIYLLDLETGETLHKDNPIRQAGALWALCTLCRERFNEPTAKAARLGIEFFAKNVITLKNGLQCTSYPGKELISTGTVALFCLALTEYLRGQEKYMDAESRMRYHGLLDAHLNYLRSMEQADGSWVSAYEVTIGIRGNRNSPYYDGEALLAYIKAAKYLGHTELLPRIDKALPALLKHYTVECWNEGQHEESKGFSQWSLMAMAEYYETDWNKHDAMIYQSALAYSWWLIHENNVEHKDGNTGYALEGLLAACSIMKAAGDKANEERIEGVVQRVMARLLTLQCGSPLSRYNQALSLLKKVPDGAEGGIISSQYDTTVRIDTHQHQMNAMMQMLNSNFKSN